MPAISIKISVLQYIYLFEFPKAILLMTFELECVHKFAQILHDVNVKFAVVSFEILHKNDLFVQKLHAIFNEKSYKNRKIRKIIEKKKRK